MGSQSSFRRVKSLPGRREIITERVRLKKKFVKDPDGEFKDNPGKNCGNQKINHKQAGQVPLVDRWPRPKKNRPSGKDRAKTGNQNFWVPAGGEEIIPAAVDQKEKKKP